MTQDLQCPTGTIAVRWSTLCTRKQACNQLGPPGGEESCEGGPNFLNYTQWL